MNIFDRLIGHSNESEVIINGKQSSCLVDTGSMITTVSEDWYKQLDPLPEIHTIEEFIVQGSDGNSLPYIGYIEAVVNVPGVSNHDISCTCTCCSEYRL
ncbi:hypothetical protein DPMN_093805 [Dreissena polymorpha]|uniref:Uncharacterized protein n=1 Tax=Dreissena polymorpha TaxID=45954 RepID=A0A9D4R2X1_DREPO|nr:hypothetical protein DPMN_093805 [Dreissena polymorpha]